MDNLTLTIQDTFTLTVTGTNCGSHLLDLLTRHNHRRQVDELLFLLLARDWFATRGFMATVHIKQGQPLVLRAVARLRLWLAQWLWKDVGIGAFDLIESGRGMSGE